MLLVSGCTDNSNSKLSNGTYEDQYVKFDYPTNLTVVATNGSYQFFNSKDANKSDSYAGQCYFGISSLKNQKEIFPNGVSEKFNNYTVYAAETKTGFTFRILLNPNGSYGPCFIIDEIVMGDDADYSYLYPQISKSLKIKKIPT